MTYINVNFVSNPKKNQNTTENYYKKMLEANFVFLCTQFISAMIQSLFFSIH